MAKEIIYTVLDNGIDGREKSRVVFASKNEEARDNWLDKSPNKNWYRKDEEIVDLEVLKEETLKTMNPIQKLALNMQ